MMHLPGARRALSRLAILGVVFAGSSARADEHEHRPGDGAHHGPDHNQIRGVRFDIHGNLDMYGMVGSGIRFEFPIVPDGFISGEVHDELALTFGADIMFAPFIPNYYDSGPYVLPIGAVQWNFYLPHNWSIFPELGVAAHIGLREDPWRGHKSIYPWPNAGFGARYHFTDRVGLLFRISTPGGFQFGMIF